MPSHSIAFTVLQPLERLVIYCQTNGDSAAHATQCATYCTPCRPLIRAFSGRIRNPPPTFSHYVAHPLHLSFPAVESEKLMVRVAQLQIFPVRQSWISKIARPNHKRFWDAAIFVSTNLSHSRLLYFARSLFHTHTCTHTQTLNRDSNLREHKTHFSFPCQTVRSLRSRSSEENPDRHACRHIALLLSTRSSNVAHKTVQVQAMWHIKQCWD